MLTADLRDMLNVCSADLEDHTAMLVAADAAQEAQEIMCERLLRRLAIITPQAMFLSGSRCYGTPREDSDWDWVVFIQNIYKTRLMESIGHKTYPPYRCGPINLILLSKWDNYYSWLKGTLELKKRKPVTKEQAIYTLRQHGVDDSEY